MEVLEGPSGQEAERHLLHDMGQSSAWPFSAVIRVQLVLSFPPRAFSLANAPNDFVVDMNVDFADWQEKLGRVPCSGQKARQKEYSGERVWTHVWTLRSFRSFRPRSVVCAVSR